MLADLGVRYAAAAAVMELVELEVVVGHCAVNFHTNIDHAEFDGGVFDAFEGQDFVALGHLATSQSHWFRESSDICREFSIREFPAFCGGFYLFSRTALSASVFNTAHDLAARYDDLGIKRLGKFRNDEPLFSLAMAAHGIPAVPLKDWIYNLNKPGRMNLHLDYALPLAEVDRRGSKVKPKIVHFQAFRLQPIYYRETFLVHARGKPWFTRPLARLVGAVQSVAVRGARRLQVI